MSTKLAALKAKKPANPKNQPLVDVCIDKLEFWIKVQAHELDLPDWVKGGVSQVRIIIKYWVVVLQFICEQMGEITKELSYFLSHEFLDPKLN